MNSTAFAVKIVVTAVAALALSSCAVGKFGERLPTQGQIFRGEVTKTMVNMSGASRMVVTAENPNPAKIDPKTQGNMRTAIVSNRFGTGLGRGIRVGKYFIPDNLEFSDLEVGAIVDVVWEKGDEIDFSKHRFNRIVRLVCKASDKACISAEKKVGTRSEPVDDNPNDDDAARFGNTYVRQATAEDYIKYK